MLKEHPSWHLLVQIEQLKHQKIYETCSQLIMKKPQNVLFEIESLSTPSLGASAK